MSAVLEPTPNLDKRFGIETDLMPSPVASAEDELCIVTDVGYNFGLPTSSLPTEVDKCTGLQLKEALEAVEGLPCDTQQLSFNGQPIRDDDLLGSLGVIPGSNLQLDLADRPAAAPVTVGSPSPRAGRANLDAAQLEELEVATE